MNGALLLLRSRASIISGPCYDYVWSRCECQQWAKVHAVQRTLGTTSTTRHGIFRPHLLFEVYRMILVQESLIICQFFEQQAKLSSDMLILYSPFIVDHATASFPNMW